MNSTCPVCRSDKKNIVNGVTICKQCGNCYIPINEITNPIIRTTLLDSGKFGKNVEIIETIFNAIMDNQDIKIEIISTKILEALEKKYTITRKEII